LSEAFNYPILSEESLDDMSRLDAEYVWVVDPLDGTKDFINATGEFTIVIALCRQNTPVLGVVYRPTTRDLYFAEKGKGAYLQTGDEEPKKIACSQEKVLSHVHVVTGESQKHDLRVIAEAEISKTTRVGSLALKGCLVAEGVYDAYFNFDLNRKTSEWDTCAAAIIVTEAGGMITGIGGRPILFNQPDVRTKQGVVMSNGFVHRELIATTSHIARDIE
jgi:3'(2'), 5'-bisphosphate nucleotidase